MTASDFLKQWRDSSKAIAVKTSGSTGDPKQIYLSKRDMMLSACATNKFFGLKDGSRFICPMSFEFIGAKMMAVRALMARGELVEVNPANNFTFDGHADLLAIVPSQVDCLINSKELISKTKNVIIGGAPLDDMTIERLLELNVNAFQTYGMTETASHVALRKVGEPHYKALPGVKFSTDDRQCLVIEMQGRDSSHIVTNDIVELVSPTLFLWQGRFDNVINSGGVKVHPELLEKEIKCIFDGAGIRYKEVLVTSRASAKWGEEVICVLEMDKESIPTCAFQLLYLLKTQLKNSMHCPKELIFVEKLHRTLSGKINRKFKDY